MSVISSILYSTTHTDTHTHTDALEFMILTVCCSCCLGTQAIFWVLFISLTVISPGLWVLFLGPAPRVCFRTFWLLWLLVTYFFILPLSLSFFDNFTWVWFLCKRWLFSIGGHRLQPSLNIWGLVAATWPPSLLCLREASVSILANLGCFSGLSVSLLLPTV